MEGVPTTIRGPEVGVGVGRRKGDMYEKGTVRWKNGF